MSVCSFANNLVDMAICVHDFCSRFKTLLVSMTVALVAACQSEPIRSGVAAGRKYEYVNDAGVAMEIRPHHLLQ